MDCINNIDGGIVFAFGTFAGKILLRYDWEEFPKYYKLEKRILAVRFSSNLDHLIAACEDGNVVIFT